MSWLKSTEYLIKDLVFALLKIFLRKGRPELIPIDPTKISKILFLRHDKIGDLVVSLPVFDNLKSRFPHLALSILCSPTNIGLIKEDPRFSRVYLYRKNFFRDLLEVRRIRKQKFDCVVDLVKGDSTSTIFLARLAAKNKPMIGFHKKKYKNFYDYSCADKASAEKHIIHHTLAVLNAFGFDSKSVGKQAGVFLPEKARAAASEFMTSLPGVTNSSHRPLLVGINLSVGKPTRQWSLANFVSLLTQIEKEHGVSCHSIIFTAPQDRARGERLVSQLGANVTPVPAGLDLVGASAIIAQLDLLISADTSLIHIARSFNRPVVGLYTRAQFNFDQWHPFEFLQGTVVSGKDNDLFDITVDAVYKKFVEIARLARERVS